MNVLVAGATGYIGRNVVQELVRRGHSVVALQRARAEPALSGVTTKIVDVENPGALSAALQAETFTHVVSCLASRTGGIKDSWAVDCNANRNLLALAREHGAQHFLLLSAICVQKPRLEFQRAKLAFEVELEASRLPFTIVRPTAFFKSLAGQLGRVKRGKPFMVFGDGARTACKPISEADLARFMVDALTAPAKNEILVVGGPGEAITPRQQGEMLSRALGRPVRLRHIPLALLDTIVFILSGLSRVIPALKDKAEYARIGRYYASESMLTWDAKHRVYDAQATPSYGSDTLQDFYTQALRRG